LGEAMRGARAIFLPAPPGRDARRPRLVFTGSREFHQIGKVTHAGVFGSKALGRDLKLGDFWPGIGAM
jgi:hypothetical protein